MLISGQIRAFQESCESVRLSVPVDPYRANYPI